jgi:calcium-dependent protein kinase
MINKSHFVGQFITDIRNYYDFFELLGSGGYGEVYRVQHKLTGDIKACKKMNKRKIVNKERFKLEVELLRSTDYPHIIRLYELFEDQIFLYLIMEECTGGDFFDRIVDRVKAKNLYTEREAAKIFKQVVSAISYCHSHGICHRDIKPENILFVNKNEDAPLKLIDFGLSKVTGDNKLLSSVVGTPFYMAPEVLKGNYDTKCDIWSLGVLLYIMLSGRQPFFGRTDNEIMTKILNINYSLNFPEFTNISNEAKFLLQSIFVEKSTRPSAIDVINNVWVKELAPNSTDVILKFDISNCITYCKMDKIHKSVASFIAFKLGENETRELAEIFKSFDCNNDGVLSFNEVKEGILLLRNKLNIDMREQEIDSLYMEMDIDKNGLINYNEFIAATMNYEKNVKKENLLDAFKHFDSNNDGFISFDELALIVRPQNKNDLEELKGLFKTFDKNDDNYITSEEFLLEFENNNSCLINLNDGLNIKSLVMKSK